MVNQSNRVVFKSADGFHRRTNKAQTLMRGALKKPAGQLNTRIQHLTPGFNPQRELRAKKITQHGRIDHFGNPIHQAVSNGQTKPLQGKLLNQRPQPKNPGPIAAGSTVALPSMITSASHQKLERMLDEALTHADAHKHALKYQAARHFWQRPGFLGKHRGLKLSLAGLLVLGISFFLAWQKLPVLSVRLAAARAHISASVPSYKPAGYNLAAPAMAQGGTVVLKYNAPDSSRGFDVAQKESNMTSVSLAQTLVPKGSQVQTSRVNGNTVYIYGKDNNAAWVNNGVLYTIADHSKLTSDEILNIARGLN